MLAIALLTIGFGGFFTSPQIKTSNLASNFPPISTSIFQATDAGKATTDKLVIENVKEGKGDPVQFGDIVSVEYTGKLTNGTVFDATSKHNNVPFTFEVGLKSVIAGWDQGLIGMKEGGERNLTIPPALGYGKEGIPPTIPPDSTLKFNIVVKKIVHVSKLEKIKITKEGTGDGLKLGDSAYLTVVATDGNGKELEKSPGPELAPMDARSIPGPVLVGLLGSKLGEERSLSLPLELLAQGKESKVKGPITFKVKIYGVNDKYIKGFKPPVAPTGGASDSKASTGSPTSPDTSKGGGK